MVVAKGGNDLHHVKKRGIAGRGKCPKEYAWGNMSKEYVRISFILKGIMFRISISS